MTTVKKRVNTSAESVWDVLADGWLYPLWVVGASRMRDVDTTWPQPGAKLHHSVGVWPALINDPTEVVAARPGECLQLLTHGWPLGAAEVVLTLKADPAGTTVVLEEDAVAGPGRLTPPLLRDRVLRWRNRESLQRLAFVAENRVG